MGITKSRVFRVRRRYVMLLEMLSLSRVTTVGQALVEMMSTSDNIQIYVLSDFVRQTKLIDSHDGFEYNTCNYNVQIYQD